MPCLLPMRPIAISSTATMFCVLHKSSTYIKRWNWNRSKRFSLELLASRLPVREPELPAMSLAYFSSSTVDVDAPSHTVVLDLPLREPEQQPDSSFVAQMPTSDCEPQASSPTAAELLRALTPRMSSCR